MDGQKKLAIVLQGLKGGCCVRELCNDHGITQGIYCKWRNQLLTDGAKLFERGGVDRARERLEHENRKLKAPRKAVTHKPRTVEPNRYWGIDMTKVMISTFGWIYLHVVMDWGTKKLLSTHMSLTSKSADWIAALNEAVNLQFPNGIREASYIPELVSDHGCQPTSTAFFKACSELGIHQIFTATAIQRAMPTLSESSEQSKRILSGQKNLIPWRNSRRL